MICLLFSITHFFLFPNLLHNFVHNAYSVESTVTKIKMEYNPSADLNVKSDAQHVPKTPGFHPGWLGGFRESRGRSQGDKEREESGGARSGEVEYQNTAA